MNKSALHKVNVLGTGVTVCDYDSATEQIVKLGLKRQSSAVTASATHLLLEAWRSEKLRARINLFDIVTPDGQPVRWGQNLVGKAGLKERVSGPELTIRLCRRAAASGLKIFLYGSTERVVQTMKKNLSDQIEGLDFVGIQPSRFRPATPEEDQADIDMINASGAHICFVGLGCPRQENWAYEHLGSVNAVMICVGAAFDFHAGLLARAPGWMQDYGLEWLFRLIREPRRLWARYAVNNPLYLYLLFLQYTGLKKFPIVISKSIAD